MKLIYDKLRRYHRQIKMLLIRDGWKKAKWLKRNKIFAEIGENCYYAPNILPAEPFLVKLHNNVVIYWSKCYNKLWSNNRNVANYIKKI
mgnify:FL=1